MYILWLNIYHSVEILCIQYEVLFILTIIITVIGAFKLSDKSKSNIKQHKMEIKKYKGSYIYMKSVLN